MHEMVFGYIVAICATAGLVMVLAALWFIGRGIVRLDREPGPRGGAPTRISFGKLRLDTGVPALVLFAIAGAFFWLGMDYTNPIGLAEAKITQLRQALATAEARAAAAEDHLQAFEFEVSGEIAWQGADQPQFAVNVCVLEQSTLRGRMLLLDMSHRLQAFRLDVIAPGHAPRTFFISTRERPHMAVVRSGRVDLGRIELQRVAQPPSRPSLAVTEEDLRRLTRTDQKPFYGGGNP